MYSRDRFSAVLDQCGITHTEAAALVGRSARTARRWQAEGAPDWAARAVLALSGFFEVVSAGHRRDWWRVVDGTVYPADSRESFTLAEGASVQFMRRALEARKLENRQLREELERVRAAVNSGPGAAANDGHITPDRRRHEYAPSVRWRTPGAQGE